MASKFNFGTMYLARGPISAFLKGTARLYEAEMEKKMYNYTAQSSKVYGKFLRDLQEMDLRRQKLAQEQAWAQQFKQRAQTGTTLSSPTGQLMGQAMENEFSIDRQLKRKEYELQIKQNEMEAERERKRAKHIQFASLLGVGVDMMNMGLSFSGMDDENK